MPNRSRNWRRASFHSLSEYELGSGTGRAAKEWLPAWLPIPAPKAYVVGFDAVKRDTEEGEFGSYLLGEWSQQGWWYYDLVAFGVKAPLPLLALLLVSPWFLRRERLPRRELLALALPLLALVALLTLNRANIGVRYLLPIYPFLFVWIGCVWAGAPGRRGAIAFAAVAAYYVGAVALVHPNHLSFFNVLAGGPSGGHRFLVDSNLDWGQDLYRLKPALEALDHEGPVRLLYFGHVHPRLYGIDYELVPNEPVADVVAVSVNYLMGYRYPVLRPNGRSERVRRNRVAWLRELEPVARAGTIWIFDTRRKGGGSPP